MFQLFKLLYDKWIFLTVLYVISFGLNVFNDGVFWDDWTVYNVELEGVLKEFFYSGYYSFGFLMKVLYPINDHIILFSRTLVFFVYFIMALILFRILSEIECFKNDKFLIITLFLLLPFNHARISFVILNHVLNYFLFFVAFLCYIYYKKHKAVSLRIISLVLFFLSFFTNSLFFFYFLFIMYLIYTEINIRSPLRLYIHVVKKHLDYFLVMIVFLILKMTLIRPHGIYEGYNKVTAKMLLVSPFNAVKDVLLVARDFIWNCISLMSLYPFLLLVFFGGICIFAYIIKINRIEKKEIKILPFGIAALILFIGILPYSMLGKTPFFNQWDSRHQLLLSLGFSLTIIALVKICFSYLNFPTFVYGLFYSFLISCSVLYNFYSCLSYERDTLKQLSVMENMKSNEVLKENTTFMFIDNCSQMNAKGRVYRFYEYTGMFKKVFHSEDRFATNDINDMKLISNYKTLSCFNISDYDEASMQYNIEISEGKIPMNYNTVLKFLLLKYTERNKYINDVRDIVRIKTTKL